MADIDAMDTQASITKTAALAAQCPPLQEISETEALQLPIYFQRAGSGPGVLIIHGGVQGALPNGPRTFEKQKALAEMSWRVEIAERPGFGRSPSRGADDLAADAVWIADELQDGMHLIGHSWGGAASLLAAARRPEAVRSLILVEPALEALALTDPHVTNNPAAMQIIFGMTNAWMEADTPQDLARRVLRSWGGVPVDLAPPAQSDDQALTCFGCSMLRRKIVPPIEMRQASDAVKQAGIPVLVVSGNWSTTMKLIGDVAARAANGRHVVMPSPNHFPQFENPHEFNRIVDEFMRQADRLYGAGGGQLERFAISHAADDDFTTTYRKRDRG